MPTYFECKKCGWSGNVNGRPRCLACYRRRVREWRSRNPDKAREQRSRYDKKFREERPEEYRAKRRKYYLPQTAKRARQRRVEWLKQGTVTNHDLIEIFELYSKRCVYCGVDVNPRFTPNDPRGFDHVKSRAQGGKHERENIVPCCRRCNELKG